MESSFPKPIPTVPLLYGIDQFCEVNWPIFDIDPQTNLPRQRVRKIMDKLIELFIAKGLFARIENERLIRVSDVSGDDEGPAYWFAIHQIPNERQIQNGFPEMLRRFYSWVREGKPVTGNEVWS
jgi:hypothetical protein